jgi:hypothetical protein
VKDNREFKRLAGCVQVGEHLGRTLAKAGRAMERLLDGGPEPFRPNCNDPDGPSDAEQAGGWWADALERSARKLLELHRVGDGPAPADFARGCLRFARALRVAAAGRWPEDLDEIHAELWRAIQEGDQDARLAARTALAAHHLTMDSLRAAGPRAIRAAALLEADCRHVTKALTDMANCAPLDPLDAWP